MDPLPIKDIAKEDLYSDAVVIDPINYINSKITQLDKRSNKQNVASEHQIPLREKVHIQEVKSFRVDPVPPSKQTAQIDVQKLTQPVKQLPVQHGAFIKQPNLQTIKSSNATSSQRSLLLSKQTKEPLNQTSQQPFSSQTNKPPKLPIQTPTFAPLSNKTISQAKQNPLSTPSNQPLKLPTRIPQHTPLSNKTISQAIQKPLSAQSNEPIKLPMRIPTHAPLSKEAISQAVNQMTPRKQSNIPANVIESLPTQKSLEPETYPEHQYVEFINEALYDSEEFAEKHVITVDEAVEDAGLPVVEEVALEYMLEMRKTSEIAIQTDEAAEDRVNCGFINVSKSGRDKNFNLCCFYCDAEYPIIFWSEFSEHILYNHVDLEEAYANENDTQLLQQQEQHANPIEENDTKSIASEMDVFHDLECASVSSDDKVHDIKNKIEKLEKETTVNKQTAKVNEILPEDFDNGDDWGDWDSESDEEQTNMRVENYEPIEDHSYSLDCFNKLNNKLAESVNPIYEINFRKTPRNIVLDFLEHLKGFPSLWHDRNRYPDSYDNELKVLLDIMKDKWELNFKKRRLRKNLENIKSWYASMTNLKKENADQFHQHTCIEYYNKCAEYLIYAFTKKLQIVNCNVCNRFCFDMIGLQVHKYRKHKIGQLPYGCNKCDKRFDYIYKLINHVKTHMRKAPKKPEEKEIVKELPPSPPKQTFDCFQCNQNFSCVNEYKRHLDIHPKGDCPFVCDECGRRYRSVSQLTVHRKHHQPPKYQCEFCPKKFYAIFRFRMHMDAHKGVYHYICEWCGRTFVLQKSYVEHRQYEHMGYGYCKICNREYKKRVIYDRHMKTMHRPIFGTVEELSQKRRRRYPKGVPLLKNRKYERVIDPVTQKHRLKCPKCDESFKRYEYVYKHARKVHNYEVPRLQRRKPERRKLPTKKNRKRSGKAAKSTAIDMAAEEAAAVNAISEFTNIKLENPDYNSNEPGSSVPINTHENMARNDTGNGMNEIPHEKNATGISFEKFINDFTTSNNFSFQSPSNMLGMYGQGTEKVDAPLVAKVEDFEGSAFEFILNANSSVVKFS